VQVFINQNHFAGKTHHGAEEYANVEFSDK
jgi:hypothetical protein